MEQIRVKGDTARMQMNINISTPFSKGMDYLASFPNQFMPHSSVDGSRKDVCSLVLGMFREPAMLSASEHGLHVDELFRRLDLPKNQIMDAINNLVDVGHIYSTVDEYHFKKWRPGAVPTAILNRSFHSIAVAYYGDSKKLSG